MSRTEDRIAQLRDEAALFTPGVIVRVRSAAHTREPMVTMVTGHEIAITSFLGPRLYVRTERGEFNASMLDILPPVTLCDIPADDDIDPHALWAADPEHAEEYPYGTEEHEHEYFAARREALTEWRS